MHISLTDISLANGHLSLMFILIILAGVPVEGNSFPEVVLQQFAARSNNNQVRVIVLWSHFAYFDYNMRASTVEIFLTTFMNSVWTL
jgi:hypothetical protein